jgi:hypothetical protein
MSDPIRYYGYVSRDKSSREEHEMLKGKQPMDVGTAGIHLILDHQVSLDDGDPDVVASVG